MEISWGAVVRTVAEEACVDVVTACRAVAEVVGPADGATRLDLVEAERVVEAASTLLAGGYPVLTAVAPLETS